MHLPRTGGAPAQSRSSTLGLCLSPPLRVLLPLLVLLTSPLGGLCGALGKMT